jgi:hypothetical protein
MAERSKSSLLVEDVGSDQRHFVGYVDSRSVSIKADDNKKSLLPPLAMRLVILAWVIDGSGKTSAP